MKKLEITGGRPLSGEVRISGAKNAALPALAASLLTGEALTLERVPHVVDINTMLRLLESIGAEVKDHNGFCTIQASQIRSPEAPYELVKTMRASSLVLGPLVARAGRAHVSMPGGCAIGARPINLHLMGLEKLGATIVQEAGYIEASAPDGLTGARIVFPKATVTGTEDLMMAATLARGETVLENAAREPEVSDLAALLTAMGADISGAGTSEIRIRGVERLGGARHRIIADRIEAGTFLAAAALTQGDVTLRDIEPEHLQALIEKLEQAGALIEYVAPDALRVRRPGPLKPVDVTTEEHPGFPTDMQAQWMALMTAAEGPSHIVETIFENRYMHAAELMRMGAGIEIAGNRATVQGRGALSGATVMASDLRASACLVIAALAAKGTTTIQRIYHLERGYEDLAGKLRGLGAAVRVLE